MTLRIVHLEDDWQDRELVAQVLRANGIACTIVTIASREDFASAIGEAPDLILADMALPGFDGLSAQAMAAAACPDVPFIYVSGSMGEENAIERLRNGATDYVLKHRLEKLPSAVRRAMLERNQRAERLRAEEALRQLNAELEDRVAERTRALTEANAALLAARQEAERANRAKSEFLSRMSHDLRTPLNAVLGFAQVLELEPLTPAQRDAVTQILRGGRHLLNLINEILDISRIEAGRLSLSLEPTAVSEIVGEAVQLIRPLADQRGLQIELTPGDRGYVLADQQRLSDVLFNLLSNAVKYNVEGGSIRVAVQSDPQRTAITISDTGPGIPAGKLPLLFKPFERLGLERSGIEGTGLGLALSKHLAEAMGGSLSVESVVEHGTTFRLELPTCAPVARPGGTGAHMESPTRPSGGVVLYIEDNVSNVQLITHVLARRPGVELLHASTGREGLGLLRSRRPSLVLLDLHLPDVSGEDVLRTVWEDPATRSVPVAVLTADATPDLKRRLLASGAAAYFTKPLDVREVLRLIDRTLERSATAG
jgi:signal transduction histidine kinase